MNEPKVSVIVPVYNVAPFIDQCMESLVNQTYKNLEIILVDDGSTDDSPAVCDKWGTLDTRVIVIHKPNGGLSDARNAGMKVMTGEYVGFVDSDDYVDTRLYEKMVAAALSTGADVVQCNYNRFYSNGVMKPDGDFPTLREFSGEECKMLADALVNGHNSLTNGLLHAAVWVCLFRRTAIADNFVSERLIGSEDIPFKSAIFLTCNKVTFIPDHLCFYRFTDSSLTRTFRYDLFTRYINLTRILNQLFVKHTGSPMNDDYLVLYSAVNTIRSMYYYHCPRNQRMDYIRKIINDGVWKKARINQSRLSKGEKLIYHCILNRKPRMLKTISDLYYSLRKFLPL